MTAIAFVACAVLAQDPATVTTNVREIARPRVGLVLSAGEAHALSQLGVVEALEEMRVPVDFVVGSGTGALIGGLYASGFSTREIRGFLTDPVWLDALSGRVPRTLLGWRQRSVDRDFLLDLPVAFAPGRIGLRSGIARTRWVSWLLARTTLRSGGVESFDELEIPFRAVATDVLAGETVVLAHGDLPSAILASIAVPGLNAPVEIDGHELASGALLAPIPVEPARAAGCDVLVVVDCALELDRPERLESFTSAHDHVRLLAGESSRRAALASLRPGDVLVAPDAKDADELDYRGAADVFGIGRAAAMELAAELARLALDADAWRVHLEERRARRRALPVLADVRVEDASGLDDDVLLDRVRSVRGSALDEDVVSEDLRRLYGLDVHERIDAEIVPRSDGSADLVFLAHEDRETLWSPRVGAAFEGVFGEDATYVIRGSFAIRPIGGSGAEWRNRLELGSRILVYSEYWQPIDRAARWFVAPALAYQQRRVNIPGDDPDAVIAIIDVQAVAARLDVGRVLGDWGELRAGLVRQGGRADIAVGPEDEDGSASFDQGYFESSILVDTVDSLAFPTQGTIGRVVVTSPAEWFGGDEQTYLQAQVDTAFSSGRWSFVLGGEYDTALDDEDALENAFPLGGFLRLSGLGRDQLSGAHVALARVATWVQLGPRDLDRRLVEWKLGGSLEAGQAWNRRDDVAIDDLRASGSLFVGMQTPFGTAVIGAGATEPGQTAMFVAFGNLFGEWDPF